MQHGRLIEADAEALQTTAADHKITFIEQLIQSKKMSALDIADFSSKTFGYPLLDLDRIDPSYIPQGILDAKAMQTQRLVPLYKRGTKLFIGISDITNMAAVENVRFQTNAQVEPIIVEDPKLAVLLSKMIEASGATLKEMVIDEAELEMAGGDDQPAQCRRPLPRQQHEIHGSKAP